MLTLWFPRSFWQRKWNCRGGSYNGDGSFLFFCFIREEFFRTRKKNRSGNKFLPDFNIILNFVYNHAAPRHCLNKFRHCSRLAVYFKKKTTRVAEGVGYMEASIFFAAEKTAAAKNLASNVKKLKSAQWQRVMDSTLLNII